MVGVDVFDRYAREYDWWYDRHPELYRAEVETLRRLMPAGGTGIEVGAGTGRFAQPLGAALGIEPSRPMARIAHERGLQIIQAIGERLPIRDGQFDFALLVTVVCFVTDVPSLLRETGRVLRPDGRVVVGLIDRDSPLGRQYEARRETDPFYRHARFYSTDDMIDMLARAGFWEMQTYQAMIGLAEEVADHHVTVRRGHGEGSFVGIGAVWSPS